MRRFRDIDGLRAAATAAKAEVEGKLAGYSRRRDTMRAQVQPLAAEYDRKRSALAKDPHHAALEALETKLKNNEQSVYALRECEFWCGCACRGVVDVSACGLASYVRPRCCPFRPVPAVVASKGRESDYEAVKAECMKLVTEVNVKAQHAQLVVADTGLLGAAALASGGVMRKA